MNHSLVAVDIGNSFVHMRLYQDRAAALDPSLDLPTLRLHSPLFAASLREEFVRWHGQQLSDSPHDWFVASVNRPAEQRLAQWVGQDRPQDRYHVLQYGDLPLAVEVDHPEKVGVDRLAAALAVNHLRLPAEPAIIVDSGSALTVDLVQSDGAFAGGAILPGVAMSARALATNTDLLPEVAFSSEPPPVVGTSTEAAIRSGLFWGLFGAVQELAARMRRELQAEPQLFVTGGGAIWRSMFQQPARYVPDLVLSGIALAGYHIGSPGATGRQR